MNKFRCWISPWFKAANIHKNNPNMTVAYWRWAYVYVYNIYLYDTFSLSSISDRPAVRWPCSFYDERTTTNAIFAHVENWMAKSNAMSARVATAATRAQWNRWEVERNFQASNHMLTRSVHICQLAAVNNKNIYTQSKWNNEKKKKKKRRKNEINNDCVKFSRRAGNGAVSLLISLPLSLF